MRRFLSIAICLSAAVGFLTARDGTPAPDGEEGEKKLIDLKSDLMGPVAPGIRRYSWWAISPHSTTVR